MSDRPELWHLRAAVGKVTAATRDLQRIIEDPPEELDRLDRSLLTFTLGQAICTLEMSHRHIIEITTRTLPHRRGT